MLVLKVLYRTAFLLLKKICIKVKHPYGHTVDVVKSLRFLESFMLTEDDTPKYVLDELNRQDEGKLADRTGA